MAPLVQLQRLAGGDDGAAVIVLVVAFPEVLDGAVVVFDNRPPDVYLLLAYFTVYIENIILPSQRILSSKAMPTLVAAKPF
ncbi:uncharacterized protein ARB_06330 [Trichophyton benhamiae CBS 112371]|uniref:Uncharacterized protein n=1 Tax=Arthroderma benhamiae (strain ATCC MYA-4681 / CBS 112371) TaxID=663331 RepID=D4AQ23_ARTBC|nr:uncharacterized protein ARB_06330 [Trichophyton benhamiae CBS 112371]EFE34567.1 hypothetical protein ARB_06330 [Trichophyton benhamiae CBS 112371]